MRSKPYTPRELEAELEKIREAVSALEFKVNACGVRGAKTYRREAFGGKCSPWSKPHGRFVDRLRSTINSIETDLQGISLLASGLQEPEL